MDTAVVVNEKPVDVGERGQEVKGKPVEIDPAESNAILDAIFTRGVFEEEVELPRGHKCVFVTRTSKQAKDILARLESDNPATRGRYNQLYGGYCLAASLRSLDSSVMPDSFDERVALLDQWAGPLLVVLLQELVKFDDKVAAATGVEQVKN